MTPTTTESFQMLPIGQLHESSLNPRKHFDDARLSELTESIRTHGILTPLLARPVEYLIGPGYELAAGHRRLRAAKEAGLDQVPVIVRPMTDTELLEVLTIENLQREDVHPLEEALGYKALMDQAGYDVATIARKVSKSASYVYQRLKLIDLAPAVQKAFVDHRITASHAILIARLDSEKQIEALDQCFDRFDGGTLISVRDLRAWIQEELGESLEDAPFGLADAVLSREAGACIDCAKISIEELLCFDRACFDKKIKLHVEALKSCGLVPISTAWNEKPSDGTLGRDQYYQLQEAEAHPEDSDDEEDERDESEIDCGHAERAVIAQGYDAGKEVRICRDPNCPVHGKALETNEKSSAREDKWKREREQAAAKERLRQAVRQRALDEILDRKWTAAALKDEVLKLALEDKLRYLSGDVLTALDKRFAFRPDVKGGKKQQSPIEMLALLKKAMVTWDEAKRAKLLLHVQLLGHLHHGDYCGTPDVLADVAKAHKIDLKAVEKAVKEEQRQKKQAKKEAEKHTPRKGCAQLTEFGKKVRTDCHNWPVQNDYGVFDRGLCQVVPCHMNGITAEILLVQTADGWRGAHSARLAEAGTGGLPCASHPAVQFQAEALLAECNALFSWADSVGGSKKNRDQAEKLKRWARKLADDAQALLGEQRIEAGELDPQDPGQAELQASAKPKRAAKKKAAAAEQTKCRVCNCTENHPCVGGCYWVEDDLCSNCVGEG